MDSKVVNPVITAKVVNFKIVNFLLSDCFFTSGFVFGLALSCWFVSENRKDLLSLIPQVPQKIA